MTAGVRGGMLLTSGTSCGKTALGTELLWPTSAAGCRAWLGTRVLSWHFCQTQDANTLSPRVWGSHPAPRQASTSCAWTTCGRRPWCGTCSSTSCASWTVSLTHKTAEMLNHLHAKSNGCFPCLERVLDGTTTGTTVLHEVQHIPCTLHGLHLWRCQRLLLPPRFARAHPLLHVLLAAPRPLCPGLGQAPCRLALWPVWHGALLASVARGAAGPLPAGWPARAQRAEVDRAATKGQMAPRLDAWSSHEDIIWTLLWHGARVDHADAKNWNPLITATYVGHRPVMELLLAHGTDPNHVDTNGRTAVSVHILCVLAGQGEAAAGVRCLRGAARPQRPHPAAGGRLREPRRAGGAAAGGQRRRGRGRRGWVHGAAH